MRKKILQEVGEKLIKIRRLAGFDRTAMAAHMGVTASAYCKNERGLFLPSLKSLLRLVETYKISLDWLILNKGPMHYGEKEKELETTISKLKTELEQERKSSEEDRKTLRQRSAFFETRPEAKELLEYMEQNPIFYYEMMIYFRKYKQEKGKPE